MKLDASKFRRLRLVISCDPQQDLFYMLPRCDLAKFLMETVLGVKYEWNNPVWEGILDQEHGFLLPDSPNFVPIIGERLRWKLNIDEHSNFTQIACLQDGMKNNKEDIFANPLLAPDIDVEETGMPIGKLYPLKLKKHWWESARIMWAIRNTNSPLLEEEIEKVLLPGMESRWVSV